MFKKIQTAHHILKEFHKFLLALEKYDAIQRLIPGVINRQQKWSSEQRLHYSYEIDTGLKYKMIKGSTAQELFVVCDSIYRQEVHDFIITLALKHRIQYK